MVLTEPKQTQMLQDQERRTTVTSLYTLRLRVANLQIMYSILTVNGCVELQIENLTDTIITEMS